MIISKSTADFTSHAGLGLIGMAIRQRTDLAAEAATVSPVRCDGMPHGDILASYVALLCLGKSDFDAIDAFRDDPYFLEALGLRQVPSAATLRQRLDANAPGFKDAIIEAAIEFLRRSEAAITPLGNGLVPLDADVTPMNNAKTKKEGVSLTYPECFMKPARRPMPWHEARITPLAVSQEVTKTTCARSTGIASGRIGRPSRTFFQPQSD
jgi:hypothetical protein